jgi:hypothetical protein
MIRRYRSLDPEAQLVVILEFCRPYVWLCAIPERCWGGNKHPYAPVDTTFAGWEYS